MSPGSDFYKQLLCPVFGPQARKALTERQRDLEMKTQQLEIKLSNKTEEDIKKARRKSTQAGELWAVCLTRSQEYRRRLEMATLPGSLPLSLCAFLPVFSFQCTIFSPACLRSRDLKG
jgi:hypothetical protein